MDSSVNGPTPEDIAKIASVLRSQNIPPIEIDGRKFYELRLSDRDWLIDAETGEKELYSVYYLMKLWRRDNPPSFDESYGKVVIGNKLMGCDEAAEWYEQ